MADGTLLFKTLLDDSGVTKGLGKIKNTAKTAFGVSAKAITAVTGAMTVGLAGLTAASVNAYAEYEQLVGGVETLFKGSSGAILKYANNAYKTAGLSANEYMKTATSFSASLLQSLGGDTEAAAKKADKAITDMADNANKMGSNMQSIQDAYQGFAKQNYTMLDNLKLGYGGTKEEMQRLLKDATALSGIKYDISSYADIVDAIHVIQDSLEITGTTSLEASTTIQGSISSMKAAWTNFLTGMADSEQDFDVLLDNLVESVVVVADNIIPRIIETVPRLVEGLGEVAGKLADYLPEIVESVLPALLKGAAALTESLVTALPELIGAVLEITPYLVDLAVQLIGTLAQGIIDSLPELVEAAGEIAGAILEGIGDLCPAIEPITDAIGFLIENLDALMPVIVGVVAAFVAWKTTMAIVVIIKTVTAAVGGTTTALGLLKLAVAALGGPVTLIIAAISAVIAALVYLWNTNDGFREAVTNAWNVIKETAEDVWGAIVEFFTVTIPEAISSVIEWFQNLPENIATAWDNLIEDIQEFVANLWDNLVQGVSDCIDNIIQFFNDLPYTIGYALGLVIGSIIQFGLDCWNWVTVELPEIIAGIIDWFASLPEKIWEWLVETAVKIVLWGEDIKKKAKEAVSGFIDNAITTIKELPGKIWDWLVKTAVKIVEWKDDLKNKAKEAIGSLCDKVEETIKDLPDKIKEAGVNVAMGFYNGVKEKIDWVRDKVGGFFSGIGDGIKDVLDIHSPSKLTEKFGVFFAQGFPRGVKKVPMDKQVSKEFVNTAGTVKRNLNGLFGHSNIRNNSSPVNNKQTINIYQPVKTPSEVARAIRLEQQYGLAGAF